MDKNAVTINIALLLSKAKRSKQPVIFSLAPTVSGLPTLTAF
jgi:hypothetical protein